MYHINTGFAILLASLATASGALAQAAPVNPAPVPIYDVTVVSRSVDAINYKYKSGPTEIGFRGTVLLPEAKGDATVESKAGRTEIDAHFKGLTSPQLFGTEYLTYVLWAITPDGHVKNLGEILANSKDNGHTQVTTDLQTFGLIVTAEPYAAVRGPSNVVVLENRILPGTNVSAVPIQARVELMPRGSYTYNVSASPAPSGPKVSMSQYEQTLELDQAYNAIQIAQTQKAEQYAPDVLAKARSEYANALQLQSRHADKNAVITAARDASQTAEDARALAATREREGELASARKDVEHADQLRLQAEAKAQSAQAQAAAALAQKAAADAALAAEQKAHRKDVEKAEVASVTPPRAAPPAETRAETRAETEPAPAAEPYQTTPATLRARLLADLKGPLETLDTGRGLEVILKDSDFQGKAVTPAAVADLGKVAGIVISHPGLQVEVDGNSDIAGDAGQRFSLDRANAVRQALISCGLNASRIAANGLGNSRPFGSGTTVQGREENRRVEVIVHGEAIGTEPVWNKPYSVDLNGQRP